MWQSRPVRFVFYFAIGGVAAILLAQWFQPRYVAWCQALSAQPDNCRPVPRQSMVGIFLVALGVMAMTIVPIVTTLTHVLRHGYDWETSRVETMASNLPILAGLIYFAIGAAVSLASY